MIVRLIRMARRPRLTANLVPTRYQVSVRPQHDEPPIRLVEDREQLSNTRGRTSSKAKVFPRLCVISIRASKSGCRFGTVSRPLSTVLRISTLEVAIEGCTVPDSSSTRTIPSPTPSTVFRLASRTAVADDSFGGAGPRPNWPS